MVFESREHNPPTIIQNQTVSLHLVVNIRLTEERLLSMPCLFLLTSMSLLRRCGCVAVPLITEFLILRNNQF